MTGLLLRRIAIDPARGGDRLGRLPFLSRGAVSIDLRSPLTLLVGENGSGKTTLLEAIAARCAIRPGGGASYAETEDDRAATALSDAVAVSLGGRRPPRGLFLRADRFAEAMADAGRLPMPATGEWRLAGEQSRGEGVLSLLTARVDGSEAMLFLLDEPETGLSPQRQMALLALLDALHRDGRSQAIVATHAPILISHPGADRLWIDDAGIGRRALEDLPHWRDMRRFLADPGAALDSLRPPPDEPAQAADEAARAAPGPRPIRPGRQRRPVRLWVLSDLHLEAVPHPQAFRPQRPAFDVLVVAGDVWEGDSGRALEVVAALADGRPAVFVLGNHEAWGRELQQARHAARRAADRLGITLLDDGEAELAGIGFVGGTLWADGRLSGAAAAAGTPTGEPILVGQPGAAHAVTRGDEAVLHRRTRGVIEAAMARPRDGCLVVVTHHAPHPLCLPPAQRTGRAAGRPASDLSALTDAGQAAAWVHGHVHATTDIARPGGTRIVCNAAGPGFTNLQFRDDWVIEV